jgi:hypothetical protein
MPTEVGNFNERFALRAADLSTWGEAGHLNLLAAFRAREHVDHVRLPRRNAHTMFSAGNDSSARGASHNV